MQAVGGWGGGAVLDSSGATGGTPYGLDPAIIADPFYTLNTPQESYPYSGYPSLTDPSQLGGYSGYPAPTDPNQLAGYPSRADPNQLAGYPSIADPSQLGGYNPYQLNPLPPDPATTPAPPSTKEVENEDLPSGSAGGGGGGPVFNLDYFPVQRK
jgi:hypothetical protein